MNLLSQDAEYGPQEGREGDALVRAMDLSRVYQVGAREINALQGVNLSLARGRVVALRGRSGSGKTTLLNCIGGLDRPTSGSVWYLGQDIARLPESRRVELRRHKIGFVFQSHALLMTYSARENVELILRLAGMGQAERRVRVEETLALVGLERWMEHRPFELSGGQQQRVAIARAIATRPPLILADEPTGELDSASGRQILGLFRQIADENRSTVLIATHDLAVDAFAHELYQLEDGQIVGHRQLEDPALEETTAQV
ncbi:MAG: ABC transporter ATP-binding protein [Candidatus Promineifilaceae bacterium]